MAWLPGWLTRLFSRRALTWDTVPEGVRHYGGPAASGVKVNEWTALNLAAWWAATRVVSEAVASVPLLTYRRLPGGGKERAPRHPLYRLLHDQPNPEMTSMVWRETKQAWILSWGNGISEIERDNAGRPIALWPLAPDQTCTRRLASGEIVYDTPDERGRMSTLDAANVLHVPGLGFDGLWGYSVARMARESIGLGLATERFGAMWFGNGARPSGVLKHPTRLNDAARRNLRESFQTVHGGISGSHGTALLEEGMDWQQVSIDPEDSQFLQTREFQREEIALWFNLPPMKLWSSKSATYASSEQFAVDFVVHTLRPWWVRWEQEISRKLLLPGERDTIFVEHLADGLLRGDSASRTSALQIQFLNGCLTLDEWRAIENRNPLPDGQGEVSWVPMNIQPVEKALAPPPPPPPPQPLPAPAPPAPPPDDEEDAEPEDDAEPEPADEARGRAVLLVRAEQDVWRDALARVVRREARDARQAAAKPGEFLSWLDAFYADLEDELRAAILPAARLRVALAGAGDPAQVAAEVAADHCQRSRELLLDVAGASRNGDLGANVAACVGRWERERPEVPAHGGVRVRP